MKETPIPYETVRKIISESQISSIGKASIREVKRLVDDIEKATNTKFVKMEMGIPGIPASQIGVDAQIESLKNNVAAIYPDIDGIPELKKQSSLFCKNYMDIDISPASCIPTVGSMMGGFASFMTPLRLNKEKDTTLFIDPGFPVQKQQHRVMGAKFETFDVYQFRGKKLREKIESILSKGHIHSMIYSNPNNPAWICFTDEELQIIGELSRKYEVTVLEDLAYFGMDFRQDFSIPGEPPYQPTVAKYTDNYILFISSSKIFSYAGERIGIMAISDKLFNTKSDDLVPFFGTPYFGRAIVYGTVYSLSAGTSHSAQHALAAIFKACNEGTYNYRDEVIDYGEKAKIMKKMFTDNGFKIVYDTDVDKPIADGFYFTISYPGFSGEELIEEFLYYGVSAISLSITGSERSEGLRACVSLVDRSQFPDLEYRLKKFNEHHQK